MDGYYPGKDKAVGEDYNVGDTPNDERKPFKAILDVGLAKTTTGNKVFGCLKGACDGGLYIPHNTKRFPGFFKDNEGNEEYKANVHRDRIFGVHVDKFMEMLKKDN